MIKFMKLSPKKLQLAVVAGAMLLTLAAAADETTTYSGINCAGANGNGAMAVSNDGTLLGYRSFSGGGTVICPLDRARSDAAGDIASPFVRLDLDGAGTVSCQGRSCDGLMSSCSWGTPGSTNSQAATFISMGSLTHQSNGFAYILCELPSNTTTKIFSYRATD